MCDVGGCFDFSKSSDRGLCRIRGTDSGFGGKCRIRKNARNGERQSPEALAGVANDDSSFVNEAASKPKLSTASATWKGDFISAVSGIRTGQVVSVAVASPTTEKGESCPAAALRGLSTALPKLETAVNGESV